MITTQHMQVASSTPGRTGFKVPENSRHPREMARLASALQTHRDVQDVQYNVQTGSILVHHAHRSGNLEEFKDILRDVGGLFTDVTGTSDLLSVGGGDSGLNFNSAIADLNQRVLQITNGVVDL